MCFRYAKSELAETHAKDALFRCLFALLDGACLPDLGAKVRTVAAKDVRAIKLSDFEAALPRVRPSVSKKTADRWVPYRRAFLPKFHRLWYKATLVSMLFSGAR